MNKLINKDSCLPLLGNQYGMTLVGYRSLFPRWTCQTCVGQCVDIETIPNHLSEPGKGFLSNLVGDKVQSHNYAFSPQIIWATCLNTIHYITMLHIPYKDWKGHRKS